MSPSLSTNSWLKTLYLFRQMISKSTRLKQHKVKQLSYGRLFKSTLTCRVDCTCGRLHTLDQKWWNSSDRYVCHITIPTFELIMMPFLNLKAAMNVYVCSRSKDFRVKKSKVYFWENSFFNSDGTIKNPLYNLMVI